MAAPQTSSPTTSPERVAELLESLAEIRSRVETASSSSIPRTLVAVSKYKPASDISACYEGGQRDFGENYVQELVEKVQQLPLEIRWHFIGNLQSNKAKSLATIPNLHTVQTLTSAKTATALNKALPSDRSAPLNVLIQINTSGEDSKSGLPPLSASSSDVVGAEVVQLSRHIIDTCPGLKLQGLMTIGALERSLSASELDENEDFEILKATREVLHGRLEKEFGGDKRVKWGDDHEGRLLLSMGMSSDFEAALKAGSDIVRVGTGIFGERRKKVDVVP